MTLVKCELERDNAINKVTMAEESSQEDNEKFVRSRQRMIN